MYSKLCLFKISAVVLLLPALGCKSLNVFPHHVHHATARGVDYLLQSQNPNGSWGSFHSGRPHELYMGNIGSFHSFTLATTALCTMALLEKRMLRPQQTEAAMRKGLRYLLNTHLPKRASATVLYNVWSLAFGSQCLARILRERVCPDLDRELNRKLHSYVQALLTIQSANGGWGYYDFGYGLRHPSGFHATSFTTGTVLCALWEAKQAGIPIPEACIKAATKCLLRMRTPDRTFAYGFYSIHRPEGIPNRPPGSLGRVHPANLALWLWKEKAVTVADMRLGLRRMFDGHRYLEGARGRPYPHEGWFANSGYYFLYGHFYAAAVIRQLPPPEQIRYRKLMAQVLLPIQNRDGSWWDFPLYSYHKAYGTAFALMALEPWSEHKEGTPGD